MKSFYRKSGTPTDRIVIHKTGDLSGFGKDSLSALLFLVLPQRCNEGDPVGLSF